MFQQIILIFDDTLFFYLPNLLPTTNMTFQQDKVLDHQIIVQKIFVIVNILFSISIFYSIVYQNANETNNLSNSKNNKRY